MLYNRFCIYRICSKDKIWIDLQASRQTLLRRLTAFTPDRASRTAFPYPYIRPADNSAPRAAAGGDFTVNP